MLTFQDFQEAVSQNQLIPFICEAITAHRNSDEYQMALIADEYDAQRNTTINAAVRRIYDLWGNKNIDSMASNNRIASNFFRRVNTQRCTYSLGNGVTFAGDDSIKERLGDKFDTDLYTAGYYALIHSVSYGFWNVDRMHVFKLTEFVPLLDENDGSLRAGIRFWSLDWGNRPVSVVLYEEDGYTKYRTKQNATGLEIEETEPKRAYRQTIIHTAAGGDEVEGEENYSSLPIVPLYGNRQHQSTLVGLREAIDSYDVIQSGFANDITDCAQVYWLIGNALGMDNEDVQQFMERLRMGHVAIADTENSSITPYTQEIPYNAREAYLKRIEDSIYRDFGAFNPADVAAGNITATQITAAYQTQDEEADAFEYQVIEFIQQILALQGLEGTPEFTRNRIANQAEQIQAVAMEAQFLDDETILKLLPNITPDMIPDILAKRDAESDVRFDDVPEGEE